jgi:hypothetical protein
MAEQVRSADYLITKALANPDILNGLKTNTEQTLKSLAEEVVQELPRPAVLPQPTAWANNVIWLIIVIAFAAVMVGAAYVLGAGITSKLEQGATYATRSDTVVTVFTTVVAFLAGLLSPSPIKK